MTIFKSALFTTAALLALSGCANAPQHQATAAAHAPKRMACMAGKDMQCGMMTQMGDMQERMAKMHMMMEACAKSNKPCAMDKMMPDMEAMHDKMKSMMGDMKGGGMMKDGMMKGMDKKPPAAAEDHSQHHPDQNGKKP